VRVLFCTQSESLPLFDALRRALELSDPIERAGFTVADSMAYSRWTAERPQFEGEGHLLLKEWDVTGNPSDKPDLALLAAYERMLGGEAGLFGAIVADRRIFMGPDCTYSQDYRRRFSDDQLLCILQRGLKAMERLFDDLKPDAVISFICVTMLDYLAYLFARARGVRVLNLRPTRIGDRVSLSSRLNDPSPELAQAYGELVGGRLTPHAETARAYIRRVREEHGRYEGVVRPSNRPVMKANVARLGRLGGLAAAIGNYLNYRRSVAARDNHVPDPMRVLWFTAVRNPRRASATRSMLRYDYVSEADLKSTRFAFFPLHTEPEVSLLVYGRPYVNQIEIIRMLAMSLPLDMALVVKEHPWMVGKRSLGAYRKMLEIPRVRLAEPSLEARTLVQHSSLVTVVTGSVALEAAMLGRPVITFGDCPYNLLPDPMVRRCDDPRRLPQLVRQALALPRPDDQALEAYVAAVYETSEGINLYSVLLGKKGVHSERVGDYAEEIHKLAQLVRQSLARPEVNAAAGCAAW
jgi:Capsule polysaccharide biosynthesis protein